MTSTAAAQVFISYAAEDGETASALAAALEREGFTVWYYARDSVPGIPHFVETGGEIERVAACVFVISKHALESTPVMDELVCAKNCGRPLIPLLVGLTDAEYKRNDVFRRAMTAATSIQLPTSGVAGVVAKIVAGLRARGITPGIAVPPVSGRQIRLGNELSLGKLLSVPDALRQFNTLKIGDHTSAKLKAIPADDLIFISGFTAARLDWQLPGDGRGNGILTREKLYALASELDRQIDRELGRQSDARSLRQDKELVERITEDMIKRDIGAVDYLPDQFRTLPERLRRDAIEVWMDHGKPEDKRGKLVITQRTIDEAMKTATLRGERSKLDDLRDIAKHLGLTP